MFDYVTLTHARSFMSEGSITFTPLLGASEHEPLAYLLDIDGFKILLDCGWNAEFNVADIEPLVKVIDQIDIILLSHNDLQHLGALPYLRRSGLQCPVYATVPVWRMGQLAVRDALLSHTNAYKFDTFTAADVDAAFGAIQTVKHMQVTFLSGRGGGITITSGLAGHSVGGAIWRITKGSEDVVYAVDFNHAKENHLDGFLPDADRRTTILISNAINARAELPKRKDRQTQMLQSVLNTLKRGGNVLLPSDSAARVLEVLSILYAYWDQQRLTDQFPLVFLSHTASSVLDNIRTLLEWCSEACLKQNDEKRDNPFSFKRLNICTSVAALDTLAMSSLSLGQTQPRPMLVVASTDDLSQSLAAELAQRWLPDPNSLLLFTNRVRPQSVAGRLMTVPKPLEVVIETKYNEALTGAELRAEMRKRELERAGPRKIDTEAAEADSEEEDEEDYDAFSAETSANSNTQTAVSAPAGVVSASSPCVAAGSAIVLLPARFGAATAFPTFPSFEDKWISDAFGEQIRPELYTLAVAESEGLVALPKANSEVTPAVDDTPVSVHSKSTAVPVRCEVLFVDCEGRSDGKGLKSIFKNLKPKTLILIHGNDDDKEHLKQYCGEQIPNCKNIFVPLKGQTLDITADLSVFSIKLKESMEQLLRWQDMPGDYQVAWVDGEIRFEGGLATLAPPREAQAGNALTMSALSAQFAELMPVESNEEMDVEAALPTLIDDEEMSDVSQIVDFGDCDMAPAGLARAAHTIMSSGDHGRGAHAQLLLGDIKLANCRTALNQEAISVNNPNAGTLVCAANAVVVRKHMAQLTVTGALGEDYYRVRDVLYSQFERI